MRSTASHRGASRLGVAVDQNLGGPRLDPHHADAVGDEIVQLARDPGAFFGRRGPASLVAFALRPAPPAAAGRGRAGPCPTPPPAGAGRTPSPRRRSRAPSPRPRSRARRRRSRGRGSRGPAARTTPRNTPSPRSGASPPKNNTVGDTNTSCTDGGGDHHRQRRRRRAPTPRHRRRVEQHQHRVQSGRTVETAAWKLVAPRAPDVHLPDDHEHQRQHRVGERRPHTIGEPANRQTHAPNLLPFQAQRQPSASVHAYTESRTRSAQNPPHASDELLPAADDTRHRRP